MDYIIRSLQSHHWGHCECTRYFLDQGNCKEISLENYECTSSAQVGIVITLFLTFIIHSFLSLFLRALSNAFNVFTLAIVSTTLMTLTIPTIPFYCYLYHILHSLSLIRNKDLIDFLETSSGYN